MTYIDAIILGVIQGLTEFLPVSSSGHLVLFQSLLGLELPGVTLELILHLATFLAVIIIFFEDIVKIFGSLIYGCKNMIRREKDFKAAWRYDEYFRLGILIVLGSIPTATIGLLLRPVFEVFFESLMWVGFFWLITGTLLWVTTIIGERHKDQGKITVWDALFIGLMQGMAIAPGLSRSGTTIAAGLLVGLKRKTAARFSFLLALPVIFGASLIDLKDALKTDVAQIASFDVLLVGFIAATIAGYAAIKFMLRIIENYGLMVFAIYTWVLGISVLIWQYFFV